MARADSAETTHDVTVVVPVYNEPNTIGAVLRRVADALADFEAEIVVVDDGSTPPLDEDLLDGGCGVATRLVRHPANRGKGAALHTGFASARGRVVVVQDADFEYDPADLPTLIEPILAGEADAVFGSRFLGENTRQWLPIRRQGNRLITWVFNVLHASRLTDIETGYKVFQAEWLRAIQLEEHRFGFEPEIAAKALAANLRVREVPISYHARTYTDGKKIKLRDAVWAIRCCCRY